MVNQIENTSALDHLVANGLEIINNIPMIREY